MKRKQLQRTGPQVYWYTFHRPQKRSHFRVRILEGGVPPRPHFGARFWSRKIWARIKNQCQMQSDNPDVASSSICSTAAKKQVQACCMYTLILTRCSNCGGPLCTTTFSKGLFGLVNEPAQPSKIEDHSVETTSTEAALCSNYCLLRMRAQ